MVRDAIPDDAGAIAEVHVATWKSAYRGILPDAELDQLDVVARAKRWASNIERPERVVLVAETETQITGFCSCSPARDADLDSETGEITAIYVRPEHWRSGIGTALLEEAMRRLPGIGFRSVSLWVFEVNHSSRRFYEALGFRHDPSAESQSHRAPEVRYIRVL